MDSDRTGLRGNVGLGLVWRGVVTTFHKVAFCWRKATLAVKKEANCYGVTPTDLSTFAPTTIAVVQV